MKKILQKILKILAKQILKKYNPEIIGVTGSVGKTSTKEAIYCILKNKFTVSENIGNYNNEIGLPLAIIGKKTAGKNIFNWSGVFLYAIKLVLMTDKKYPKILILEMAVDKPGDMDYLLDIAKPTIGVLTKVGPVHLENFKIQQKILDEKSKMIKVLTDKDFAILNYDAKDVLSLCDQTKAKCITYGLEEGADVRAKNILLGESQSSFTLEYGDKNTPIIILSSTGRGQIYSILAGIACALSYGLDLDYIKESIKSYKTPEGRGSLLKGIKNTLIIDETYNSSPQAVEMALSNLGDLADSKRTIAVLGDMLELGSISRDAHKHIGQRVRDMGVNYLFTVGKEAKNIASSAKDAGMHEDKVFHFDNNQDLLKILLENIEDNDVILVKGSRGMKMEEIVEKLLITND